MASQSEKTRVVRASGIDFHLLEMGAGPLVLCLHGFPDTAHSFRHQMPMLADAGFHVVAPFMRGYAPTGAAPDGRYEIAALAEDALALIDALGEKDAILFGHDWGAVAAYEAAAAAPKKIRKLITAAVRYGPQFFEALVTNYAQQRRSWYMYFFQSAIAEMAVSLNDFAFLEKIWADWSPGWKWAPEDMEALKRCFRAPGTLGAALGYYRATLGPVFRPPSSTDASRSSRRDAPDRSARDDAPRTQRRMHRRRADRRDGGVFSARTEDRNHRECRPLRASGEARAGQPADCRFSKVALARRLRFSRAYRPSRNPTPRSSCSSAARSAPDRLRRRDRGARRIVCTAPRCDS